VIALNKIAFLPDGKWEGGQFCIIGHIRGKCKKNLDKTPKTAKIKQIHNKGGDR